MIESVFVRDRSIVYHMRYDGMAVTSIVLGDHQPGWVHLITRLQTTIAIEDVYGVFATASEAVDKANEVTGAIEHEADVRGLLHPIPWGPLSFVLVIDSVQKKLDFRPSNDATRNFMRLRPTYFGALLKRWSIDVANAKVSFNRFEPGHRAPPAGVLDVRRIAHGVMSDIKRFFDDAGRNVNVTVDMR